MEKNSLKKKFLKIFVLDILFVAVLIGLILFIRQNLISYVGSLQVIQGNIESIGTSNIQDVSVLMTSLEKNANKAFIYAFVISPLLFYLLYVFIQGMTWSIIKKRSKRFFLKFSLISIPAYVFLVLFLANSFRNIFYGILTFVFWYIAFIFYINPETEMIKKSFRKIYLFLPFFVLYLVIFFAYLLSGFLAFISLFVGNYSVIVPFSLFITLVFSLYKILLIEKFG
ncbi:hypothetical protein J4214_03500 [Candidatus Woesearchaeota archaeon]|nr:hypothetical protein [Candidatus Woesearchaeota archaeon]